jgi:hypothetical protein
VDSIFAYWWRCLNCFFRYQWRGERFNWRFEGEGKKETHEDCFYVASTAPVQLDVDVLRLLGNYLHYLTLIVNNSAVVGARWNQVNARACSSHTVAFSEDTRINRAAFWTLIKVDSKPVGTSLWMWLKLKHSPSLLSSSVDGRALSFLCYVNGKGSPS